MTSADGQVRKVAWITGGSRGIGADAARRLAEVGYHVALTARDRQRLHAVARDVESRGGRALAVPSDLTDLASLDVFADEAVSWGGRCDVLCNIGVYQGSGMRQLFMDTSMDELSKALVADVVAPALLSRRALMLMTGHGGGTIVNMSSAVVFLRPTGTVHDSGWSLAYAAGKAGIDQFGKVLNAELGAAGVRVFTVEPGFTAYGDSFHAVVRDRPGVPVSPPEAVGAAMVWLVESPEADRLLHTRVHLPDVTAKHGLLPGWDGPGTPYPTA